MGRWRRGVHSRPISEAGRSVLFGSFWDIVDNGRTIPNVTEKLPTRDTRPKSRKIQQNWVSQAASSVLADLYLFEFMIFLGGRSMTAV